MIDQSFAYPVGFYISIAILGVVALYAWNLRWLGLGIPMLVVLATVTAWYFIDPWYNDYLRYIQTIGVESLDAAWFQVALFLISFALLSPFMHRAMNKKILHEKSYLIRAVQWRGIDYPDFQNKLDIAAKGLMIVWFLLIAFALLKTNFDFMGLFFPYLTGRSKASPWARGRIGGGFDAIIAFAMYIHIMITAIFGVVAAISKNIKTRFYSIVIYGMSIPWFLLDRTRSYMLATFLPFLLALVFLRMKGGLIFKVIILILTFNIVDGWMKFVLQIRSEADVSVVFQAVGFGGVRERLESNKSKHLGLNMFEELGWINKFIETKHYTPNWGARYFAELVNPIPRVIWKNKPLIGIDYSIARGQAFGGGGAKSAGVGATISTGMIGQGVVNFGVFLGPIGAAFLMACWVAILARQDLMGGQSGRLLLLIIGLVLTFNMGRDITLLVVYPFIFGYAFLKIWLRLKGRGV